jgi:hypothetical protein
LVRALRAPLYGGWKEQLLEQRAFSIAAKPDSLLKRTVSG